MLTALEIVAYTAASLFYLSYLIAPRRGGDRVGRAALGIGAAFQLVDVGVRCVHSQHPLSSVAEVMALVGWMIAVGFLIASVRYRLAAAGAFAAPAALVMLVLARVVPAAPGAPAMGMLGRAHILLATVGVAVFTLAAILAVLYLVEERQMKRKQFGRMLGGGTPLDTLDRLASRCVSLGFPVFTVAIVTGAVWIARLGFVTGMQSLRFEHLLAVVTWVAFGVLLVARVGAGWQGRRAAWLTLGGFGGAFLVLVVYFVRHAAS